MECPYCKKEMLEGKIPTVRSNVCWYPADKEITLFSETDDDVIPLAKMGWWEAGGAPAYRCEECNVVLIPVPEKQETTMDKLKKKWSDISHKMEAASEARQTRQEEERKEKQREKRGKKDPWER